jgi:hypothetical protein
MPFGHLVEHLFPGFEPLPEMQKAPLAQGFVAEREGFEPSIALYEL